MPVRMDPVLNRDIGVRHSEMLQMRSAGEPRHDHGRGRKEGNADGEQARLESLTKSVTTAWMDCVMAGTPIPADRLDEVKHWLPTWMWKHIKVTA